MGGRRIGALRWLGGLALAAGMACGGRTGLEGGVAGAGGAVATAGARSAGAGRAAAGRAGAVAAGGNGGSSAGGPARAEGGFSGSMTLASAGRASLCPDVFTPALVPEITYSLDSGFVTSIAAADLNGDGPLDLVITTYDEIEGMGGQVLFGIGNGDFFDGPALAVGMSKAMPFATLGDVTGDGIPDVVGTNLESANSVSVLEGRGDGNFDLLGTYAVGSGVSSALLADIDADGALDLVTVSYYGNTVSLLRGHSDGTLTDRIDYTVGWAPSSAAVADLDQDGRNDIAVANHLDGTVSVLFAADGGTFTRHDFPAGSSQNGLAVGDLNGDGLTDLIGATLLLAQGRGSFANWTDYPGGSQQHYLDPPIWLAVADYDEDGVPDVVLSDDTSALASVLPGTGDGAFRTPVPATPPGRGGHGVAGDFNGDHHADLALATGMGTRVLLGDGHGGLSGDFLRLVGSAPVALTAADLTGDGKPDFAVANSGNATISTFFSAGDDISSRGPDLPAGAGVNSVKAGDFDHDGHMDLAFTNGDEGTLGVALGLGGGVFSGTLNYPAGSGPRALALYDVNGDGNLDAFIVEHDSAMVRVARGDGRGGFAVHLDFPVHGSPDYLALSDLNRDGAVDVVVTSARSKTVEVLFGDAAGDLSQGWALELDTPQGVAIGDLDGDGVDDLAIASGAGPYSFLLFGRGDGSFDAPLFVQFGAKVREIVIADLDGDGLPDLSAISDDSEVLVALGQGGRAFGVPSHYGVGFEPFDLIATDADNDGALDLATANFGDDSLSLLTNACKKRR